MSGTDEAAALLAELRARGAVLTADGGELRVRARPGALDRGQRTAIRANKAGLLALLAAADADAKGGTDGPLVAATAGNVLAATAEERAGWRREVVHALVWVEAGRRDDPHLAHDLVALRRIVPVGTCLHCDGPCEPDGRHWCDGCAARHAAGMRRTG